LNDINLSPAQLFLNRNLKSRLPVTIKYLEPKIVTRTFTNQKAQHYYNRTSNSLAEFNKGDDVLFMKNNKWFSGKILKKHEFAPRNYIIEDKFGNQYRRNRIYLRKSYSSDDTIIPTTSSSSNNEETATSDSKEPAPAVVTRSGRVVRMPEKYKDFV